MDRHSRIRRSPLARMHARKSAPTVPTKEEQERSAKRQCTTHDFVSTFDVYVGKPPFRIQRFVLHTNVFEGRTALSVERSDDDTVHLIHEDPAVFLEYLNCVYYGLDTKDQWADASDTLGQQDDRYTRDKKQQVADALFEKLIRIYVIAESLVDYKTANMASDEIIRFSDAVNLVPTQTPVLLVYTSKKRSPLNTLRKLLSDMWIYAKRNLHVERLRTNEFPQDFVCDVAVGLYETAWVHDRDELDFSVKDRVNMDKCWYHLHHQLGSDCSDD